jgi:CHAT domain-containing protein
MWNSASKLICALLLAALCAGTAAAKAQRVEAERVRRAADRAMADGRYADALRGYRLFLDAVPRLGVLADDPSVFAAAEQLGLLYRTLGYYPEALAHFRGLADWARARLPDKLDVLAADEAETLAYLGYYRQARDALIALLAKPRLERPFSARLRRMLSTCEGALGNYAAQKKNAESAFAAFKQEADEDGIALAEAALAEFHISQNDFPQALKLLEGARARLKEKKKDDPARSSLLLTFSTTYQGLGRYQDAVASAQESLDLASKQRTTEATAAANATLAESYFLVGDMDRAREGFEKSLECYESLGALDDIARRAYQVGRVALATSNPPKAERYFRRSLEVYRETGQDIGTAIALGGQGDVARALGRPGESLAFHAQALGLFEKAGEKNGISGELVNVGLAQAELGQADAALASLARAESIASDPDTRWRASYARSVALRAKGDREGARAALELALRVQDDMRQTITLRQLKGSFGAQEERARVYEDLAFLLLDLGRDVEAFATIEQFRARVFREMVQQRSLLGGKAAAAAAATPAPAALLKMVSGSLASDQTLLSYFVGKKELAIFVVRRDGMSVVRANVAEGDLREWVQEYRTLVLSLQPEEELGRRLHDALIAPVEHLLKTPRLVLVPHDVLHYLPWSALRDRSGAFLASRFALGFLPAADTAALIAGRPYSTVGPVLALGNPDLGDPSLALPFAEAEVHSIASAKGTATIALFGADASRAAFINHAPGASLIHLALHGELHVDRPLESALRLAPAVGGALTVGDVLGMRLSAQLVVLSACESGRGRLVRGDELVGLSRAFLEAGARALVSTLWSVADRSTSELMGHFYRELPRQQPDVALAAAQRAMMRSRDHGHPFHWAAFTFSGVGR